MTDDDTLRLWVEAQSSDPAPEQLRLADIAEVRRR